MKNFTQIIFLTLMMAICVILELLQKIVIWDSTPIDNIRYTFKDYKEDCRPLVRKIYWPNVFATFGAIFGCITLFYYIKEDVSKMILSGLTSILVLCWSILLDTRPTYEVMGNNKYSLYVLFLSLIMIILFSSCNRGQCPTTNKQYFMRGVPKSKSLYRGYGSVKYSVPYKYRKTVVNYGKLKTY
jgi:hypothetical protein